MANTDEGYESNADSYFNYNVGDTIRGGVNPSGGFTPKTDPASGYGSGGYSYQVPSGAIDIYGSPVPDSGSTGSGTSTPSGATPSLTGWAGLGGQSTTQSSGQSYSGSRSGSSPVSYQTGGGQQQTGSTGTITKTPTMPMPTLTKTTPYTNPTWSPEQIKAYAQEDSALGISEARDALYDVVNKVVSMQGNPTAQAAAMRDALKGHGSAIAQTMRGANKEALARYQMMYQNQINEAMARFNAGQQAAQMKYNAEMQAYLNSMKSTTTTGTTPASGGGGMYNPNATRTASYGG